MLQPLMTFWAELKRRHVFRVAAVYGLVAWLVIQVAVNTFPALQLPGWTTTFVVVIAALGFPIALVLAWAFDLTPTGVRRTEAPRVDDSPAAAKPSPASVSTARIQVPKILPEVGRRATRTASTRPEPAADTEVAPPDPERVKRASLANLRHELRTPLNAIIGYSEMLLEDAEEIGGGDLVPDLREIQGLGRQLLARIDERLRVVPGGEPLGEVRELQQQLAVELETPTLELLEKSGSLLDRCSAAGLAEAADDVQRLSTAASRLLGMARELANPPEPSAHDAGAPGGGLFQTVAERVMAHLRPLGTRSGEFMAPQAGSLLVVDDNALNRDLLSRQLARQGHRVSTAAHGREALDLLRRQDFDLVLLDVMMPELNGVEVLERMQADATLCDIPVIMISALDEIDSVVRCIEKGAVDYLAKPFDPVLLQARIGATLEVRTLREQQRRALDALERERAWSERLATGLLPASLAERLRKGEERSLDVAPDATVLVVELDGTSTLAARSGPEQLLGAVTAAFDLLDRVSAEFPVETMRLGGRSWMAIAGVPAAREDHADVAADLALALATALAGPEGVTEPLRLGIGLHTGPVVVGMSGDARLLCGVWGEAVDTARSLGLRGDAGTAHVSPGVYARLRDRFVFESRGVTEIPGQGQMRTYRLMGRKLAPAPAP